MIQTRCSMSRTHCSIQSRCQKSHCRHPTSLIRFPMTQSHRTCPSHHLCRHRNRRHPSCRRTNHRLKNDPQMRCHRLGHSRRFHCPRWCGVHGHLHHRPRCSPNCAVRAHDQQRRRHCFHRRHLTFAVRGSGRRFRHLSHPRHPNRHHLWRTRQSAIDTADRARRFHRGLSGAAGTTEMTLVCALLRIRRITRTSRQSVYSHFWPEPPSFLTFYPLDPKQNLNTAEYPSNRFVLEVTG